VAALVAAPCGPSLASLRATRASDGKRESARETDTQPLAGNSRRKEAEERPGLWL